MKRRKYIYDYGRHYHNDRFVGWRVWKVPPVKKEPEADAVAEFFGRDAKKNAQAFSRVLNAEKVG